MPVLSETFLERYKNQRNRCKGVLTDSETEEHIKQFGWFVVAVSDKYKVYFFSDDEEIGIEISDHDWVFMYSSFPGHVIRRKGIEDGKIDTIGRYKIAYLGGKRHITSVDELIAFINELLVKDG